MDIKKLIEKTGQITFDLTQKVSVFSENLGDKALDASENLVSEIEEREALREAAREASEKIDEPKRETEITLSDLVREAEPTSPSGNNWSRGSDYKRVRTDAKLKNFTPDFVLEPEVAQEFNAYAQAAYPMEIGGLLRLVLQEDGKYHAVELAILEQRVQGAYFEMEAEAVAAFNMKLFREGKKDQIPEWRCLIHSHPSMTPFLSGVDVKNLAQLAGDEWAFSVICSAEDNPDNNYYAVHYAQSAPIELMISDIYLGAGNLAGCDSVSADRREEIRQNVRELCSATGEMNADLPQVSDSSPEREPERVEPGLTEDLWDTDFYDTADPSRPAVVDNAQPEGLELYLREDQWRVCDYALDEDVVTDTFEREIIETARETLGSETIDFKSLKAIVVGLAVISEDEQNYMPDDRQIAVELIDYFQEEVPNLVNPFQY